MKQKKINLNELIEENKQLKKCLSSPNVLKYQPVKLNFSKKKVKFLAFSDTHIGNKDFREDIFCYMIEDAKRNKCEFAINSGDTIEGMSGRDGHIYELSHIGATEQMSYFEKLFKKFDNISKDFKVYSIEANSSHGGWFKSKGNMGLDIGKELENKSNHYKFIGYDEQDLVLKNGLKIRLVHPGGGQGIYTVSYKLQRYIEAISGGQKPHMIFQGHFHKSFYLHYRNVHGYSSGTLENQTIFMKKINTPAHLGYWICEVTLKEKVKDKGKLIERVNNTFVPFFE